MPSLGMAHYGEYKRGVRDGQSNKYKAHKGALGAFLTGWSRDDDRKKKSYDRGWDKGRKKR